tara:strand:- start:411 stop:1496 length:1086 start_codon:yes stop_codon:yes gene_type:complete
MSLNKEITLLLVIYNRPKYSLKWIKKSITNKVPFNILIADAGNDRKLEISIKKSIKKHENIKYLKCKYFSPHSKNYLYNFVHATNKIKTKYTYICEDEDFIIPKNIIKSAKFLEKNKKFTVSAGQNINITKESIGLLNYCVFNTEQNFSVGNLNQDKSDERMIKFLDGLHLSHWNCLHRTLNLRKILSILNKVKFNNFMIFEIHFNLLVLFYGKSKRFNHIEYIKNNDISTSSSYSYLEKIDLINIISKKNFSKENYQSIFLLKKFLSKTSYNKIEKKLCNNLENSYKYWIYYSNYYKTKNYLIKSKIKDFLKKIKIFYILKLFSTIIEYKKIKNKFYFSKNDFSEKLIKRNINLLNKSCF